MGPSKLITILVVASFSPSWLEANHTTTPLVAFWAPLISMINVSGQQVQNPLYTQHRLPWRSPPGQSVNIPAMVVAPGTSVVCEDGGGWEGLMSGLEQPSTPLANKHLACSWLPRCWQAGGLSSQVVPLVSSCQFYTWTEPWKGALHMQDFTTTPWQQLWKWGCLSSISLCALKVRQIKWIIQKCTMAAGVKWPSSTCYLWDGTV